MSDLDKILRHISTDENFEKDFSIADVQREIFPEKNSDQVEYLLKTIIAYKLKIVNVFSLSISPVIMANGLTKDFLDNGGFTKIENDLENERIKKSEREIKADKLMDLDLKLKKFESRIGKKIVVAGIIITVLNLLISFLTTEFRVFDDKQSTQTNQVKKLEQMKSQSKLKDSLN